MKKLTIFVIVVLLLAMTTVPAFAHPGASDDGVATAKGAAGPSPVGSNISDSGGENASGTAFDNIVAHNPICGIHP